MTWGWGCDKKEITMTEIHKGTFLSIWEEDESSAVKMAYEGHVGGEHRLSLTFFSF